MNRRLKRSFAVSLIVAFGISGECEAGNPISDFFKRLGDSIAHPHQSPPPRKTQKNRARATTVKEPAGSQDERTKTATKDAQVGAPSATPTPSIAHAAVSVPQADRKPRDPPYGVPVPNKPGFVTSPYAPHQGFVDVRGFPSGTEVKDPYTGKIFLTP